MKLLVDTKKAYYEVNEIINLLDKADREKIPEKLREYFKNEMDKDYVKKIDLNIPLKEQKLKRETIAIMAMLNLNYISTDKSEKEKLQKKYMENEQRYQKELSEKYNVNNLFNVEKDEKTKELVVQKKKGFFKKVANFIKQIFRKKG